MHEARSASARAPVGMSKLVLLHAFPLDDRMWNHQLRSFTGADVEAPRLYGRGHSFDEWAASVLKEVDGDMVVVGASMGGYVAMAIAKAAPERLRAMVLVGARVEVDAPERRQARDALIEDIRAKGPEAIWAKDDLENGPSGADLIAAVENLRDREDATETIRRLPCPLLVVLGDGDHLMTAEEGRALADLAPDGRFYSVEQSGHLPIIDNSETFDAVLHDFVKLLS